MADFFKPDYIETGGHVRLSSGGPTMVVSNIQPDGMVETVWFNEAGDVNRSAFRAIELFMVRGNVHRRPLKPSQKASDGFGWMSTNVCERM